MISSTTKLTHGFRFDQNLTEGSDSRIDTDVALVVSISPLARRELVEPLLADLDLGAIEKAWRESG